MVRRLQIAATIAITAVACAAPPAVYAMLRTPIMLLLVLALGIPHGAFDHVMHEHLQHIRHRTSRSDRSHGALQLHGTTAARHGTPTGSWLASMPSMAAMYTTYLLIMAAWSLSWTVAPSLTLAAFLAVSAFHFGESDLDAIDFAAAYPPAVAPAVFASRGILLVGLTMASDPSISVPILTELVGHDCHASHPWLYPAIVTQHVAVLSALAVLHPSLASASACGHHKTRSVAGRHDSHARFPAASTVSAPSARLWMCEMCRALLYVAVFRLTDPLMGFAVYFGLWHSLGSMAADIAFLKAGSHPMFGPSVASLDGTGSNSGNNEKDAIDAIAAHQDRVTLGDFARCYRAAVPYTAVAILSMAGFYAVFPLLRNDATNATRSTVETAATGSQQVDTSVRLWAVFVMAISVLTGPHVWVVAVKHSLPVPPPPVHHSDSGIDVADSQAG
ncbi:beta-carotene 15,15'-dioxygenase-domain-containing protein [Entophlyctis helioformis]|nr:beta-carotene 15,15'-dioxygenase-domain-containing protein [Entophlyctis helioformis]